jgi:hypothetical protein
MNQLFKLQNEKTWKSLLLTDDSLMLVNKSYSSAEEFLEKFNEKGLLKERLELSILDITKISHPEKEGQKATITYPYKNSEKTLELSFVSEAEQQQFIQIVSRARKMVASVAQVSTWKAISPFVIGLVITAFFTFLTYSDAEIIEAGGEVDTSGRRSLYKQLFAWLGGVLGTNGAIAAGSIIGLLCIYFIYKRLQSKPNEIVYA